MYDAADVSVADADPKVDLYTWFGNDPDYYGGEVGLAFLGGCCKDYSKTSFIEWRKTTVETAGVNLYKSNLCINADL